jgi:hypothetical protein
VPLKQRERTERKRRIWEMTQRRGLKKKEEGYQRKWQKTTKNMDRKNILKQKIKIRK